jgi:hypothetical protein
MCHSSVLRVLKTDAKIGVLDKRNENFESKKEMLESTKASKELLAFYNLN